VQGFVVAQMPRMHVAFVMAIHQLVSAVWIPMHAITTKQRSSLVSQNVFMKQHPKHAMAFVSTIQIVVAIATGT
jgi:hypothetical protein